jgi:8-amino-3,8-dideoxy-alpha-D-manno-octulosonate transaminase
MGKQVWLLELDHSVTEKHTQHFKNYYDKVTVFSKKPHESWTYFFLKVTLHWLLMPVSDQQLNEDEEIGQDIKILSTATDIENTQMLPGLLDRPTPIFINVAIETTSACNLKCSYCPNATIGRPEHLMDISLFNRIIDGIAEFVPTYSGRISPHFYGEPLLDPRLKHLIAYAHQRLPNARIELFTNGILLTVANYYALKYAGVSNFIISQHTPEPVPELMKTLQTIERETPELYTVHYFDQFHYPLKMNRGGSITMNAPIQLVMRCNAFRELIFDVQGNAVLCCNDYCSSQTFGNIEYATVREIWESPTYITARNLLAFTYFPFEICNKCFKYINQPDSIKWKYTYSA